MRLEDRRDLLKWLAVGAAGAALVPRHAFAYAEERPIDYSSDELVLSGHRFFGSVSKSLAQVVETATERWGRPNGYILGEEASGAIAAGLRYGEGAALHPQRRRRTAVLAGGRRSASTAVATVTAP